MIGLQTEVLDFKVCFDNKNYGFNQCSSHKKYQWQFKVQLFWEGHKIFRNLPYGFDIYLVNVKTIRQIAQIFVASSEKLNFKIVTYRIL